MALTIDRRAAIRIQACQGCGACILTCPARALHPALGNPAVDRARCTGCGECIEVCPVDAIGFTDPAVSYPPPAQSEEARHPNDKKDERCAP